MKKKYYVLLIIMLIISILAIKVYAASSFTTTMTPSSTNVSEATEVVVTVAVSNLDVGDNGINSFSAYLAYDTDVFETLTDSSVEGLNSWSATYSTSSGMIALLKSSFVNEDQEIMQITLKVKSGVEEGTEGTISLSNVVVSNSDEDISGTNVSTTITVGTSTSNAETNSTTNNTANVINITTNNTYNSASNNNTTTNVTTNSTYNTTTTNNIVATNTSSDDDIPYTGSESNAYIQIILGVIFIALVFYIKFRKIDEDVK